MASAGRCQDKMAAESQHCYRWYVPTTHRVMLATSHSLTVHAVLVRASGTSRNTSATCRIVASGLMDSIGLYAIPNAEDYDKCRWWLDIFGIGDLADKPFLQLSSGEQRLVLLARAFVKDPQLLILDEPLHGLDLWNRRLTKDVIETFCQRKGKTLIMVTHYQEELPNIITNHLFLEKQI